MSNSERSRKKLLSLVSLSKETLDNLSDSTAAEIFGGSVDTQDVEATIKITGGLIKTKFRCPKPPPPPATTLQCELGSL